MTRSVSSLFPNSFPGFLASRFIVKLPRQRRLFPNRDRGRGGLLEFVRVRSILEACFPAAAAAGVLYAHKSRILLEISRQNFESARHRPRQTRKLSGQRYCRQLFSTCADLR